jgi:hypothetical protein
MRGLNTKRPVSCHMGRSLVILQSNYIPWKGYFDLLAAADEFVIFDEVQFTKRDWRNRNRIILNGELHWLTIPVKTAGTFGQPIDEIKVSNPDWTHVHLDCLRQAYRKAAYFSDIFPALEKAYDKARDLNRLTQINELLLGVLAGLLAIETPLVRSQIVPRTTPDPTDRLIEICKARGATCYISGPAAKAYLQRARFDAAGITLKYANYSGYGAYEQGTVAFEHGVSIVDVLMRCGKDARHHLKSPAGPESFLDDA